MYRTSKSAQPEHKLGGAYGCMYRGSVSPWDQVILGARVVSLACDICFFSFYLLFTLVAVLRFNFWKGLIFFFSGSRWRRRWLRGIFSTREDGFIPWLEGWVWVYRWAFRDGLWNLGFLGFGAGRLFEGWVEEILGKGMERKWLGDDTTLYLALCTLSFCRGLRLG